MKKIVLFLSIGAFLPVILFAQATTVSADANWQLQQVVLKNTAEADFIIRSGDVDNLGFGWPQGFDPFCGRMSVSHSFPWDANPTDLPGFDRILLSSNYDAAKEHPCGSDGYSVSFDAASSRPVSWSLPTQAVKGATISNAYLQIFMDDFQAPAYCSKFLLYLNGRRFIEGEKLLNAIDQTGPVGKLVSIPLTEEFYVLLNRYPYMSVMIDEATGSADGFAVDFIRLLVNRKTVNSCKGNIRGKVLMKGSGKPIINARVFTADNISVFTNRKGEFEIKDLLTGFEVLGASATGYTDSTATADIGRGDDNAEVMIYLSGGTSATFDEKPISVGESITLNTILFDQAKAALQLASLPELDKLAAFLQANPNAEIELSGHTSAEGEAAYNRSLSYKRVMACKEYIVSKGIATDRIIAIGFGSERPVAPNDSETGRIKNRRVEMRLKKL